MTSKTVVIFVGPAGSGKSTIVYAYAKWIHEFLGHRPYKVNLDPAAEYIPYEPDYDIRTVVDAHRVAKEFGLGPNGALLKSMDLIAERIDEVVNVIRSSDNHFVLIDTPGQMEVFLFRDVAFKLANGLKSAAKNMVAVFVVDADVVKRYEDYAFLAIISVAIQTRLGIDVVPVINKIDLAPVNEIVGDVISDIDTVISKLNGLGVYGDMMKELLNVIAMYSKAVRVPRISAKNFVGLEELHRIVHEITCSCGDLT